MKFCVQKKIQGKKMGFKKSFVSKIKLCRKNDIESWRFEAQQNFIGKKNCQQFLDIFFVNS